jgi:hypothetical protein
MGPEGLALFIPILALSIPIVAIIANAVVKKNRVDPNQGRKIEALEARVQELESALTRVSGDVDRLEDKQNFISRLLEDKT